MAASYRDLKVWQQGMSLTERVYAVTSGFPAAEKYGLVQQMRRASVSVPSNIAEGYGRRTPRQRYHFLETALGSLFELETQVELSLRLEFLHHDDAAEVAAIIRDCGRALMALMRYVSNEARGTPRNSEEPRNRGTE